METLCTNKIFFIDTLSADATFILNHVHQDKIITDRDYRNLKLSDGTPESIVTNLLDKLMNKRDKTCRRFLQLLQKETIQETYPALKDHFNKDSPVMAIQEVIEYKMSSVPRGICVIINNVIFAPPLAERRGSEHDKESLENVFEWLGFQVRVFENQTAEQMKSLLKSMSQENHKGDCFVCCILSYGSIDGVLGTDGEIVCTENIFGPFRGTSCKTLVSKPKLFFIQACRGPSIQTSDAAHCDDLRATGVGTEEEQEASDFLVARPTVIGKFSFRDTRSGSWFIQSLCNQLRKHCPLGEDIQSILLYVNEEVSGKAVKLRSFTAKQMPTYQVTLRKKLVFRVPNQH